MMLAALPRRQADDISGELFVAAYQRQLAHLSEPQVQFLCDRALQTCRWFPTIAECLEIVGQFRRDDEAVHRKRRASTLVAREKNSRWYDRQEWRRLKTPEMTQEMVDAMSPEMKRMGITCGALYEDSEGVVRPSVVTPCDDPNSDGPY